MSMSVLLCVEVVLCVVLNKHSMLLMSMSILSKLLLKCRTKRSLICFQKLMMMKMICWTLPLLLLIRELFDMHTCSRTAIGPAFLASEQCISCRSRLGCQIIAAPELDGLKVRIPSATRNFAVDGYVPKPH